jgi:hypothetical protein
MIFLEIPFFRHYVFAVVQKSSSPTHPGGNPPSIRYARASGRKGTGNMVDDVGESRTRSMHCTPHDSPNFTTGTVALLFKPHAGSSASAATYIKFVLSPKIFFFGKDFQKTMRKLLVLNLFLIFEFFLDRDYVAPFQGFADDVIPDPGRCPGLVCRALTGLSQHRRSG